MENIEKILDWLVELDIAYYKTTIEPDYTSYFYLKGSQERITSKEIIDIFNNSASDTTNENWEHAIAENIVWQKRQ